VQVREAGTLRGADRLPFGERRDQIAALLADKLVQDERLQAGQDGNGESFSKESPSRLPRLV
jgi:hypothetical protein